MPEETLTTTPSNSAVSSNLGSRVKRNRSGLVLNGDEKVTTGFCVYPVPGLTMISDTTLPFKSTASTTAWSLPVFGGEIVTLGGKEYPEPLFTIVRLLTEP